MVTAECSMIHSVYLLRASTSSSTLWEIGSNREDSGDVERGKDFIGCSVHQSHGSAVTLPAYNTEAELEYTVILAKQCYIRKRLDSHKFLKYLWSRRTHRGYSNFLPTVVLFKPTECALNNFLFYLFFNALLTQKMYRIVTRSKHNMLQNTICIT